MRKEFLFAALFIFTVLFPLAAVISFTNMPLTDDVRVFIGAAHQSDLNELSFPRNVDQAWELKPIGNRILWRYVTYWGEWIDAITRSDIGIPILAVILTMIISYLLSVRIAGFCHGEMDLIYIVLFLSLITPFNICIMQAEWWSILLSYLALYLLLKEDSTSIALAGILTIFIASLKLSTVMMVPTVFVAYLLLAGYDKKTVFEKGVPYVAGVVTGLCLAAVWIFWLPNVLSDILFAMNVAHASRGVSISFLDGIAYFIYYTYLQIVDIPALLAGLIAGGVLLCVCIRLWLNSKDRTEATIHAGLVCLLWLLPSIAIFLQQEFFVYHYTMLIFPAVVSIILVGNLVPSRYLHLFYIIILGSIAVFWLLHCSIWSPNYSAQQGFWDKIDSDANTLEVKYNLSEQKSLLYMTNANPPYWFRAPSACRQIGSLPIIYNMTGTKEYQETENCIQNYRGEYVIAVHDMGNTIPPISGAEISRSMPDRYLKNYTKIETMTNWELYRRIPS